MQTHTENLVLSIFPGIDLFGQAFESKGFCVVRGPDPITMGDIRHFFPPSGVFEGVIGGPPCQDFSLARRTPPTGHGLAMLAQFARIVQTTQPLWSLMENVPTVPDLQIIGYQRQRLDVRGTEVGLNQRRIRHFQFYSKIPQPLCVPRTICPGRTSPAATASEARRTTRRTFDDFCRLQGLAEAPDLSGFTKAARYHAVGNGVPLPMGELLASAIQRWKLQKSRKIICRCGCGRPIAGREICATAACRKRLQRRRRSHNEELERLTTPLFEDIVL